MPEKHGVALREVPIAKRLLISQGLHHVAVDWECAAGFIFGVGGIQHDQTVFKVYLRP